MGLGKDRVRSGVRCLRRLSEYRFDTGPGLVDPVLPDPTGTIRPLRDSGHV